MRFTRQVATSTRARSASAALKKEGELSMLWTLCPCAVSLAVVNTRVVRASRAPGVDAPPVVSPASHRNLASDIPMGRSLRRIRLPSGDQRTSSKPKK